MVVLGWVKLYRLWCLKLGVFQLTSSNWNPQFPPRMGVDWNHHIWAFIINPLPWMFWPFWAEVPINCLDHMATQLVHRVTIDGTKIWRKKTLLACRNSGKDNHPTIAATWVTKKKKKQPYLPLNPGCLIGIFILVYHNPHISGYSMIPYTLKNQGLFQCSYDYLFFSVKSPVQFRTPVGNTYISPIKAGMYSNPPRDRDPLTCSSDLFGSGMWIFTS